MADLDSLHLHVWWTAQFPLCTTVRNAEVSGIKGVERGWGDDQGEISWLFEGLDWNQKKGVGFAFQACREAGVGGWAWARQAERDGACLGNGGLSRGIRFPC